MAGEDFYLGTDNRWHRKGWLDVLPGEAPQDPTTPPSARPLLQIASMQATAVPRPVDPVDPDPPSSNRLRNAYYGACVHNDGTPAQVVSKFGTKSSLRTFDSGKTITGPVPTRPSGVSVWHHSWKAGVNATFTRAQIVRGCANMLDGDVAEVNHEHDNDADVAGAVVSKNNFHAAVAAAREAGDIANIYTCDTFTGYAFASENNANQDAKAANSDLVGSDWDGIDPYAMKAFNLNAGTAWPSNANPMYYDFYGHEYAETVAFMNKHGYIGWCIPEISTFRDDRSDVDGTIRAGWINQQVGKINAAPIRPYYVAFFDFSNRSFAGTSQYDAHLECLHTTAEINAWRAAVASNPAT